MEKGRFKKNSKIVFRMLKSLCKKKYGKRYIFFQVLLMLFDSLIQIGYIFLPGMIINELTLDKRLSVITLYLALLCLIPLMNHLKNITIQIYIKKIRLRIIRSYNIDYQNHLLDIEYETFENPAIRELKQRVCVNMPAPLYMVERLIPFLRAIIDVLILSSIIVTLNPVLIVIIVVIMIINSFITKKINKKSFKIKQEMSKYDNAYYTHFFSLSESHSAKEIRLYNVKSFFINLFSYYGNKSDNLSIKEEKYRCYMQTVHVLTNIVQTLILYSYLIYNVSEKGLAIGTMTVFISAIAKFSGTLNAVFDRYLNISKYCLEADEYCRLVDIPTIQSKSGTKMPIFDSDSIIEFKDVSFKYPGSNKYALRHLNLKIHGNQKLCIVGANGSGKTTFVKLLTRLYTPSEGSILLNGINIEEYNIEKYQSLFSMVFQDFNIYDFSLATNISLSEEFDEKKLENALAKSGVDSFVEKLPKKYYTQMLKNLDPEGIEPSGGEGQKIAIARAIYHDAPLYLLDEPTASLDPNSEYEIYSKFNSMISDRAAILITHRLSAVQLADTVAVFDEGTIKELGSHNELYEKNGAYTEMFDKQAQFYRNEKEK